MGAGNRADQTTDDTKSPTLQRQIKAGRKQQFRATTSALTIDVFNGDQRRTAAVKDPSVPQKPTGEHNRNRTLADQLGWI